jgi:hypothetical protein
LRYSLKTQANPKKKKKRKKKKDNEKQKNKMKEVPPISLRGDVRE